MGGPEYGVQRGWKVADNSAVGYILEVDLAYPQHLHDSHKDLPFCLENKTPPGIYPPSSPTHSDIKKRIVLIFICF